MSVIGYNRNEMATLYLVKIYCVMYRVAQKNRATLSHCKYNIKFYDRIAWKLVYFCNIIC